MLRYVLAVCALGLACLSYASAEVTAIDVKVPMPDGRIVGGINADIRQYPHQISMRYNGRHRCGGSIYSPSVVVSAAHCVIGTDASLMSIVAGSTLLSEKTWELQVIKYIMHDKYKELNNDYDAAVLVLRGQFPINEYIKPIPLAKSRPNPGDEVIVTGWGTLVEGGSIPDRLQQVRVNYVENSECRKSYMFTLTSRMLCAGVPAGGKDACQGDSGGPLVFNNELVGIVSWGIGCARKGFPGIYASVPDLHDWIQTTANANRIEFA